MIAPLMLAIADLALWLLWRESWTYEDDLLSIIIFSLAFSVLVWFVIEFWTLVTSFDGSEQSE